MKARRCARSFAVAVTLAAGSVGAAGVTSAAAAPVVPDTTEIRQTTKTTGLGHNPILRWRPARDAASYVVIVQTRERRPYWTWEGTDTQVRLGGGGEDAVKNSEGASLRRPMVWFVVGRDSSGAVVASSPRRNLAPAR